MTRLKSADCAGNLTATDRLAPEMRNNFVGFPLAKTPRIVAIQKIASIRRQKKLKLNLKMINWREWLLGIRLLLYQNYVGLCNRLSEALTTLHFEGEEKGFSQASKRISSNKLEAFDWISYNLIMIAEADWMCARLNPVLSPCDPRFIHRSIETEEKSFQSISNSWTCANKA